MTLASLPVKKCVERNSGREFPDRTLIGQEGLSEMVLSPPTRAGGQVFSGSSAIRSRPDHPGLAA